MYKQRPFNIQHLGKGVTYMGKYLEHRGLKNSFSKQIQD